MVFAMINVPLSRVKGIALLLCIGVSRFLPAATFQRPEFFSDGGTLEIKTGVSSDCIGIDIWSCKLWFRPRGSAGVLFYGEVKKNNFFLVSLVDSFLQLTYWHESYSAVITNRHSLPSVSDMWHAFDIRTFALNKTTHTFLIEHASATSAFQSNTAKIGLWPSVYLGNVPEDALVKSVVNDSSVFDFYNGAIAHLEFTLKDGKKVYVLHDSKVRLFANFERYSQNVREFEGPPCNSHSCGESEVCKLILDHSTGIFSRSCFSCPFLCSDESKALKHTDSHWYTCSNDTIEDASPTDECEYFPACPDPNSCRDGSLCLHLDGVDKCLCVGHIMGQDEAPCGCSELADKTCKSSAACIMPCDNGLCVLAKPALSKCVCDLGYTGAQCDQNIDECQCNPCVRGSCKDMENAFICNCIAGYTGLTCESAVAGCASQPCRNGECLDGVKPTFTCHCGIFYTGILCETELGACLSAPCMHGTCEVRGDGYFCSCDGGYWGKMCQLDVSECDSYPCLNGTCMDKVNGYSCECSDGYSGLRCEIEKDECWSNPCKQGECKDEIASFSCICESGFTGFLCQSDLNGCNAWNNPCMRGKCKEETAGFSCICESGFIGPLCQTNLNECSSNPCANGQCLDGEDFFRCDCVAGFTGRTCETDTSPCSSKPCNFGSCADLLNGFECSCEVGFTGIICDSEIDHCDNHSCPNGVCLDGLTSYSCSCHAGYTGVACETDMDECASTPCKHGDCSDSANEFSCVCDEGFSGGLCDEDIDDCLSNPCVKGTCTDKVNAYECICEHGAVGQHCDEIMNNCQSSPCGKGLCSSSEHDYVCQCPTGFNGKHCSDVNIRCASIPCNDIDGCEHRYSDIPCECLMDARGMNLSCLEISEICSGNPCRGKVSVLDDQCHKTSYFGYSCACQWKTPVTICKAQPAEIQCLSNNCNLNDGIKTRSEAISYELSCKKECGENIVPEHTSWKLAALGKEIDSPAIKTDGTLFSLDTNSFTGNGPFSVTASVNYGFFPLWNTSIDFRVIDPPKPLSCTITPSSGVETDTLFEIACPYEATNLDKSSSVSQVFVEIHQSFYGQAPFLIARNNVSLKTVGILSTTASLIAGDAADGYKTIVIFSVSDPYGQKVSTQMEANVKPSKNLETAKSHMETFLSKSDDQRDLTDVIQIVSIIKSHGSEMSSSMIDEAVDGVVTQLANVNSTNVQDVQNGLTTASFVLEQTSLGLSTGQVIEVGKSVNRMGESFAEKSPNIDFDTKLEMAASFVKATGKVTSSCKKAVSSQNLTKAESKETLDANIETVNTLEKTIAAVKSSLTDQDGPLAVNSSEVSIYVNKVSTNSAPQSDIETQQGGVALPGVTLDAGDCYAIESSFFENNPYWNLTEASGNNGPSMKFQVDGCNEPGTSRKKRLITDLLVTLARGYIVKILKPKAAEDSDVVNKTLEKSDQILYHRFPLTESRPSKPVKVVLYPISDSLLNVYVGFDYNATSENHSIMSTLPDSGSNELEIPLEELNGVDTLVVGVQKPCSTGEDSSNCSTVITYRYRIGFIQCSIWDKDKQIWLENKQCQLVSDGKDSVSVKPGKFGVIKAVFFIPPNTIDFADVLGNFSEKIKENYDVLVVVVIILIIFYEGLIFHRAVDNLDHKRWKSVQTRDTTESDPHLYEVHIHTGNYKDAGEVCTVEINIHGKRSSSGYKSLLADDEDDLIFYRAGVKAFLLSTPRNLGDPTKVELVISSTKPRDLNWHLNLVVIVDMVTLAWYPFIYRDWVHKVAETEEETVALKSYDGFKQTENLLSRNLHNMFINSHSWVSSFHRTIKTTFTRVQRWTCCCFALMTVMLCNAMWFDVSFGENAISLDIGGWKIPVQAFVKTTYSSMIVIVTTGILSVVFAKTRVSEKEEGMHFMTYAPIAQMHNKAILPHFVIYFAHGVAHLMVWLSACLCVLYSLEWGRETARIWIVAFFLGLILNVFVLQPIQILLVAGNLTFVEHIDSDLLMYYTVFPKASANDGKH